MQRNPRRAQHEGMEKSSQSPAEIRFQYERGRDSEEDRCDEMRCIGEHCVLLVGIERVELQGRELYQLANRVLKMILLVATQTASEYP